MTEGWSSTGLIDSFVVFLLLVGMAILLRVLEFRERFCRLKLKTWDKMMFTSGSGGEEIEKVHDINKV